MNKIVKNKTICGISFIGYDDGSFEISNNKLCKDNSVKLNKEDVRKLVDFLTSEAIYRFIDGKIVPVTCQ